MTWNLEDGAIQLTNLSHIGIAVENAESTAKFFSSIWNIGSPEVVEYEPSKDELFVGELFKVRLAFIKFGPFNFELLQPLDNSSIWSRFIREKGEGIHHVALGVSNYDEMVTTLQERGHQLLLSAVYEGCRWCYFDTGPGGAVLEFREEYPRL
jgi:methylmalonyl-CoA/ethylmalonyl-CoA epimerase